MKEFYKYYVQTFREFINSLDLETLTPNERETRLEGALSAIDRTFGLLTGKSLNIYIDDDEYIIKVTTQQYGMTEIVYEEAI